MPAVLRFCVVLGAAIVAAATIGKLVPHIPRLAAHFDISLAAAGFLVSSMMLPGTLAGPLLGALADRVAPRRIALAGLLLEALGSAALPFSPNIWAFLALRLLEGVGFALFSVAATLIVVAGSTPRRRTLALAGWSSFAPLGFAFGQLAAANATSEAIGLWHGAVLAAAALIMLSSVPPSAAPAPRSSRLVHALRYPPALRTALSFGCVAGLLLGAVAVAPVALAASAGLTVAETARLTALAAIPGIAGRFLSGWLLGKWSALRVFVAAAALGLLFIPPALMLPVWFGLALMSFAAFQVCMGVLAGVMSAMLPQVTPSAQQLGTVTGFSNQMAHAGNLLGPPLVLGVYAAAGAGAASALLIIAVALSVWLVSGIAPYRRVLAA